MAVKSKSESGDRSNRFRFMMLDADLSDSNVNALAQVIVSALKPEAPVAPKRIPGVVTTVTNRLPAAATPANVNGNHGESSIEAESGTPELRLDEELIAASTSTPAPIRTRKPSKPTQPKFVDNLLFPTPADVASFHAFVA
jgi:hypothetical protein